MKFILYSRSYCHLCEDMLVQLRSLPSIANVMVEIIDVDSSDELVAQFDELVPVLFGQRQGELPVRLCHYFLDAETVERFVDAAN